MRVLLGILLLQGKHQDQKACWGRKDWFISSHSYIAVHHQMKSSQEIKQVSFCESTADAEAIVVCCCLASYQLLSLLSFRTLGHQPRYGTTHMDWTLH